MKNIIIAAIAVSLASCTYRTANQQSTEESTGNTRSDTLCYLRTDGTKNQDSTKLSLMISDNQVSGSLNWVPHEKDSRRGTLKGEKNGNIIAAKWTYMQEGTTDSMQIEFKLEDGKLAQKGTKIDPGTGKESVDLTSNYHIKFEQVPCGN